MHSEEGLSGEEFVHVAPKQFAEFIAEHGLDPRRTGGRVYVTKQRYLAGRSLRDLESMLYKKSLRLEKAGYFASGGAVKVVLPATIEAVYRGMTTRPGGVPQWTYEGPVLQNLRIVEVQ